MPLTPELVKQAWQLLQAGQSQAETARALRIPPSTLHTLIAKETWRHVTDGLGDLPPTRKGRPPKPPTIDQAGAATAETSDLPDPPREPRQRPHRPPEPVPVDDPKGRDFLRAEIALIHRIGHRRQGG
jgi:hypothetical protein